MNWDGCAAAYDSQVSVQVAQADKCTTSEATIDITTTGTTLEGTIAHRVLDSDGQVVVAEATTTASLTKAGSYVLESWWLGCVVKRTPFTVVLSEYRLRISSLDSYF